MSQNVYTATKIRTAYFKKIIQRIARGMERFFATDMDRVNLPTNVKLPTNKYP